MDMNEYARNVKEAVKFLQAKVAFTPRAGLILGSGLGELAEAVQNPIVIPYEEIPHFKKSTAPGHAGRLVCGTLSGLPVAVMQGRLHCYEGNTPKESTFPVRVLGVWGVKTLFVTNACGGVNFDLQAGDVALITDHINLTGKNPLTGPNVDEWGPRFPDMSEAYSKRLIALVEEAAKSLGQITRRGVYLGLAGPSYETPAEIRMARAIGADLVGMSTVHEVIVANQIGMEVCGISCVSNLAAGMRPVKLSEEEVLTEMSRAAHRISALVAKSFAMLAADE